MSLPKYQIGDTVWVAVTGRREARETCKDCAGTRFLTVLLGDGEQVTIECEGCSPGGYEPARGYNIYAEHYAEARQAQINRAEGGENGWEYGTSESYRHAESDIYLTRPEAEKRAAHLAEERTKEQLEKVQHKYKKHRTWSWNATYHRKCIRKAKKDIEYHTAKLDYAKHFLGNENNNSHDSEKEEENG
jgi:hypothetical protein